MEKKERLKDEQSVSLLTLACGRVTGARLAAAMEISAAKIIWRGLLILCNFPRRYFALWNFFFASLLIYTLFKVSFYEKGERVIALLIKAAAEQSFLFRFIFWSCYNGGFEETETMRCKILWSNEFERANRFNEWRRRRRPSIFVSD